jgi:starch-binding outer membrane protein, SusD/RagB family
MKSIYKLFAVVLLVIGLVSCEKKLTDLTPIDLIPAPLAIQTLADVNSGVNGVYATLSGRNPANLSSFMTDEVRLGTGAEYRNVGNILFQWIFVSDNGDVGAGWPNLYAVIDRANRILEFMAPVPTPTAADVALKAQYRGELLAVRAFAHLELLRWYSITNEYNPTALGIVVQKEFVRAPGSYKPARVSQADAMTLINSDLTEARTLIPASFVNIGRITRNTVIGLQVRAALHTKNWQGVVDRATEIIPAQPVSSIAIYPAIWTTRSLPENQSTEVLWKINIQPSNLGSAIGSLWQDVGTGAVQASPAVKLMNTFDQVNDVRFSTFFRTSPRNLIAKYGVVIGTNGENFQYDVKMMRTSEILLARAEAYAELNQGALANADLSLLRTNRITGYTHTALSGSALINAIMEERYKELCYEGHRYFDLRRRSLPINRDINDAAGQVPIQNLLSNNFRYILPIPLNETQANANMQQNPGY